MIITLTIVFGTIVPLFTPILALSATNATDLQRTQLYNAIEQPLLMVFLLNVIQWCIPIIRWNMKSLEIVGDKKTK
jgi:hypothetical protein